MTFAFQKIRLETASYRSLIGNWTEMKLVVSEASAMAVFLGYGFSPDIAAAFTTLALDWEPAIYVAKDRLCLPEPGEYLLILLGEDLFACRDQQKFLLPDAPAVVEVEAGG